MEPYPGTRDQGRSYGPLSVTVFRFLIDSAHCCRKGEPRKGRNCGGARGYAKRQIGGGLQSGRSQQHTAATGSIQRFIWKRATSASRRTQQFATGNQETDGLDVDASGAPVPSPATRKNGAVRPSGCVPQVACHVDGRRRFSDGLLGDGLRLRGWAGAHNA